MRCLPLLIAILGLCSMCGGKSLSPAAARIRDGSEVNITDCTLLQKVEGSASDTDKDAQTHAKNQAKEQAAALGATVILWVVPCCTYVEGNAYRCDTPVE